MKRRHRSARSTMETVVRLQRHTSAARTFHAGLVSETHRQLHALRAFDRHLSTLRQSYAEPRDKLVAADQSCEALVRLEHLKAPWRETYRDLRRSLRRIKALLGRIVIDSRPNRVTKRVAHSAPRVIAARR